MADLSLFLIAFVTSATFAYFSTPVVIRLVTKFGLIDDPKKNKHPKVIHTQPVPRGGGLALFIAIATSIVLFLPLDKHVWAILMGAFLVTVIGLLDDKYNLNPYTRLGMHFFAAGFPIAAGIGISFLSNPLGGIIDVSHPQISFYLFGEMRSIWILSDLFAVFWIVFLMNMLNMGAKGLPGQLPGVVGIAALTISILSLKFSADIAQWPVIILALITAGAYIGFTPYNFFPQKIMPSYGGSTLAGYMLGVLTILSTTKVGTLVVVLAIPIADVGYSVVRRVAAGKSPVWGDRGHLHHKLLDSGLSQKQITILYWTSTALLGILALNLKSAYKFYTIIAVGIFIGIALLWLTLNLKKNQK